VLTDRQVDESTTWKHNVSAACRRRRHNKTMLQQPAICLSQLTTSTKCKVKKQMQQPTFMR